MASGLLIICLGILFLMNNLGFIRGSIGHLILPMLFIFLGGSLIIKGIPGRKRSGEW